MLKIMTVDTITFPVEINQYQVITSHKSEVVKCDILLVTLVCDNPQRHKTKITLAKFEALPHLPVAIPVQ